MYGTYHFILMFLSIVIAIFGSFISLTIISDIRHQTEGQQNLKAILAGLTMATGIWSMHFIGMLSLQLPIKLSFEPKTTLLSYVIAIVGTVPAMFLFKLQQLTLRHYFSITLLLSTSICAMHYTGMSAILIKPALHYSTTLVVTSIVTAFLASFIALSIVFRWQKNTKIPLFSRLFSSIALGLAISATHYTGMHSVEFSPLSQAIDYNSGFATTELAYALSSSTLLIMFFFLFVSLEHKNYIVLKVIAMIVLSETSVTLLIPLFLKVNMPRYTETVFNIFFLVLMIAPVAGTLRNRLQTSRSTQHFAEQSLQVQEAINRLLMLPLFDLKKKELLNRALKIVIELPWLKTMEKGAIFLTGSNSNTLTMAAEYQLSDDTKKNCAEIAFGDCSCGKTADTLQTHFSTEVFSKNQPCFEKSEHNAHYTIPLLIEEKLYGVLCLYVTAGHEFDEKESALLTTLSSAIATLLERKDTQQQIQLAHTVFEHNLSCLMITDQQNKILNVNKAFSLVTGYMPEDVIGKTPALLKSGKHNQTFYDELWQHLITDGHWEGEIWNKRKNGEIFPEWLSITSVTDNKGDIQNFVATFADETKRREDETRIKQLAFYDPLTGLANRTLFHDRLERTITHAKRYHNKFSLMFIDLDRFKAVNDTLGHNVGDEFLKEVASRLLTCLRKSDTLARVGGDEFVAILKEGDEQQSGTVANHRVAEKILYQLALPFVYSNHTFHSGASIGIAIYPSDGDNSISLIQRADAAMYEAKNAGRNTYRYFSHAMADKIARRLELEQALRLAIEKQQFSMVYQPLFDIIEKRIIGAEALLRWQHPHFGWVTPNEFIHLAEECGIIGDIGEWCIKEIIQQLQSWDKHAEQKIRLIAINVSVHQLKNLDFAKQIIATVKASKIDPKRLELEITEGGFAQYPDEIYHVLKELRTFGFKLAIDDFGTAYSSLNRLSSFKVDLLKIDRSFVMDMTENQDNASIVKAIIEMAEALGLTTLAEGVESKEQLLMLQKLGCRRAQGYYFSKPLPPDSFCDAFLKKSLSISFG